MKKKKKTPITHSPTVELASALINIPSITPNDHGCQNLIKQRLQAIGFKIESLNSNGVANFFAHRGKEGPLFVFSGHTDVVPSGPEQKWTTNPFAASIREGSLYGRGAADMKGALAAMVIATERFVEKHPKHAGSIGFMITSDEEGDANDGTIKIVEYLQAKKIPIDWCLIGEATSNEKLGDSIKIGRRGSLHGFLRVLGKQGHIAYPHLAENPIHRSFKALDQLTQIEWDKGNSDFTPTSMQIYNILADTGASNIIPGALTARFNFRFAPVSTAQQLQERVHKTLDDHQLNYTINWKLSSQPFLSARGKLLDATMQAVQSICSIETNPNTSGGTSDGRFIAATGCEIVELGVINHSIHQVNEHVNIDDLNTLTAIYENILERLL